MADSKNIKIIQTLASGGTAVLFKAIQTSLDRVVAVKRLHQHLTGDENFTRRFILEAKAAASLDHPNIVRVIDFGQEEEGYQMVMEYVEGESLKEVLGRWRPIKHDLALAVVHQILLGLEHAHAKRIVHRDIKPGNVMVTKQGKVKITDFGLAKLTQSSQSHTADDSILGTPLYMSPEQAFGESVDQRSDLFSLGTVLYEMLTGRQPFASENYVGVIQNIINKKVESVREFHNEIPAEVDAIVSKALSRDREQRFKSARDFREAIEDYLGRDRLGQLGASIGVLLEHSTITQVMSSPAIDTVRPRKSSSGGRVFAALFAFVLAVSAGAIAVDPALLEYVSRVASLPAGIGVQKSQMTDPGTFHFDMSEIVDEEHEPIVPAADSARAAAQSGAAEQGAPPAADESHAGTPAQDVARQEPTPEPKPRVGYLSINAQPSAEIYIDGNYRGDTPPQMRVELRAGHHKVEARHPRYEAYEENLKITAGELSRRVITLKKLTGMISLVTDPEAELYVDGSLYGTTPILRPIELDAGPHTLAIQKSGYFTWTSKVTVEAKKTLPLKIALSPRY